METAYPAPTPAAYCNPQVGQACPDGTFCSYPNGYNCGIDPRTGHPYNRCRCPGSLLETKESVNHSKSEGAYQAPAPAAYCNPQVGQACPDGTYCSYPNGYNCGIDSRTGYPYNRCACPGSLLETTEAVNRSKADGATYCNP